MEIEHEDLTTSTCVVRLRGRLNMVAAPQLRSAVAEAVTRGRTRVVVDLTEVSFIDSSGLGALVSGLKQTRKEQGDLRIMGAGPQVSTVLGLTKLDRVFGAHTSLESATDGW